MSRAVTVVNGATGNTMEISTDAMQFLDDLQALAGLTAQRVAQLPVTEHAKQVAESVQRFRRATGNDDAFAFAAEHFEQLIEMELRHQTGADLQ